MNPDDLNDRTWPQLKECVLVAVAALEEFAGSSSVAENALARIEHILSEDWEGPVS